MKEEGVPGSGSNDDLDGAPLIDVSKLRRRGERVPAVDEVQADEPPEDAKEAPPAEAKQCKICLGGVEEESELGRLISPCKCKGTIKYVHIECLNEWRKVPAHSTSF
jgi:NAD-dependent DNA ligase